MLRQCHTYDEAINYLEEKYETPKDKWHITRKYNPHIEKDESVFSYIFICVDFTLSSLFFFHKKSNPMHKEYKKWHDYVLSIQDADERLDTLIKELVEYNNTNTCPKIEEIIK